jgi:hypothetical protein
LEHGKASDNFRTAATALGRAIAIDYKPMSFGLEGYLPAP